MATRVRLRRHQIDDLEVIRDLNVDTLQSLVSGIRSVDPVPLRPDKLVKCVAELLGERSEAADAIVRQVLAVNGLMRQAGIGIEQAMDGIRYSIGSNASWSEDEKEKWKALEHVFRDLVSAPACRLVSTALDLSYDYANLLRRAKILTDIRPLYSKDAGMIEGAVISHTLRLRFDNLENEHQLSIAMDEEDIRKLSQECDRALRKAETARDLMCSKAQVSTIISGESDDA